PAAEKPSRNLSFLRGTTAALYRASQTGSQGNTKLAPEQVDNPSEIEDTMNKTTWFAASIAMSLTVGYGASILSGESAAPEARATSVERTIVVTADGGPVMLPALTVVVKVPAKRRNTTVLASSTTEEVTATWTHPEIAVVMKVPAKEEVP